MGEKGIDISEWQAGMDVERVCRENAFTYVMVRTNYGPSHDDLQFHRHCDGAERAGAIVTPYVYPLATDTRGSIDDAIRIIGGRYDRAIVDWENGSGGGDHLRAAHERVWEHGLKTPVVYDPAWYYRQVGSPNVDWMGQSGRIGGRWKSSYPDNIPGTFEEILKKVPDAWWNDTRGGITTQILQFSSVVRAKGWEGKNLDGNYFRGTHDQLVALLTSGEEEDVLEYPRDYPAFEQMFQRALVYSSRDKGPEPTHENGPTIPERVNHIKSTVDDLAARPAGTITLTPENLAVIRTGLAEEIVDLMDARARDGRPETGPTT
jgi:hypothetical protein